MIEETYQPGYYRVCVNIDLDAVCYNIVESKKRLSSGTKLMAVIKADGYGHGAVPIARVLNAYVKVYGVAIIEEAVELRKAGILKPIMILGAIAKEQIPTVVAYDVIATVFSFEMAEAIAIEAEKQRKSAKVHIKIDTGMGRLGFLPTQEAVHEIIKICNLPHLNAEGIFTHFSCADHKDKSSANVQINKFTEFIKKLESEGVTFLVRHASNSAAIVDMPEIQLNMVRSGITTYGLYPSDEVLKENLKLRPALEFKTHVSHVKRVKKGTFIGYGSTYTTESDRVIATIPVGYADGYSRKLSNKGRVLIKGQFAEVVGRICMDQFMVDVTDIRDVLIGDVVTLVGRDGGNYIPVEEPANLSGSFNYEFICNISKRVPRIYYKNGQPFLVRHDI